MMFFNTMSSRAKLSAKARACISLQPLILLPMLLACQPKARPDSSPTAASSSGTEGTEVLDITGSVYHAAQRTKAVEQQEADACKAWSLSKGQAAYFFDLSRPLAEGELHDFDWLPCSIKGHVSAKGRTWEFEINAAGTSTWRSGEEAILMGCDQAACEPLVILMKDNAGS